MHARARNLCCGAQFWGCCFSNTFVCLPGQWPMWHSHRHRARTEGETSGILLFKPFFSAWMGGAIKHSTCFQPSVWPINFPQFALSLTAIFWCEHTGTLYSYIHGPLLYHLHIYLYTFWHLMRHVTEYDSWVFKKNFTHCIYKITNLTSVSAQPLVHWIVWQVDRIFFKIILMLS